MNKFINLRNGRINVTSYRYADPKAYDFLNQYGIKCGTRHGGTVFVLDWDAFVVFADNTVVVDIA